MAIVLASGSPPAIMAAVLAGLFGGFGITPPVVSAALYFVLKGTSALPTPALPGPAVTASLQAEAAFRAAYLVNAAGRIQNAVNTGMPLDQAIANEMRFYQLHQAAQVNRRNAAADADKIGSDGHLLIWVAKMDSRTTAECRIANGHTYTVGNPPSIGYPGAVHPFCRCKSRRAPLLMRADPVEDALSRELTPALVGAH